MVACSQEQSLANGNMQHVTLCDLVTCVAHMPSVVNEEVSRVQRSEAVYGVLLAGERVVGLAQPRAHALHAEDLLLLSSFVLGSDSFRAAAESFSPICLPRFNPSAFLHAYVHYLDPVRGCPYIVESAKTRSKPCQEPACMPPGVSRHSDIAITVQFRMSCLFLYSKLPCSDCVLVPTPA